MAGASDHSGVANTVSVHWQGKWQGLLLNVALAIWFFMVSVNSLGNWSVTALQAVMVLVTPFLVSLPNRRGMVIITFGLCALSFGLSNFLLHVERVPLVSWSSGMVWLAHLLFVFLLLRLLGKDVSSRGNEKVLLRCAAVVSVFSICFVNVGITFLIQWHVALIEMFFVVAALFFLKLPSLDRGGAVPLLMLLSLSMMISNILATVDGKGLADWYRVTEILVHAVFAVAMFHWFGSDNKASKTIGLAILAAIVVYFIVLVVRWNLLAEPALYNWVTQPPFFRNIRHLAYFLCVGMVVGAWAVFAFAGHSKVFALLAFVLAASMLLWSGGRGGFVAACMGGICLQFRFGFKEHAQSWRWILLGILAAFLFSALFPVDSPLMGWLSAMFRTGGASSADQVSSGRLAIWTSLIPHIVERPWFGWGGEAFMTLRESRRFVQVHNGLLQLLIEWGIVGTLLVAVLIGRVFLTGVWNGLRKGYSVQTSESLAFGIPLVMSLLFLSMVDGVFYYGLPLAFMMIGLACIQAAVTDGCSSEHRVAQS